MVTPCLKGLDHLATTIVAWQHQHGRHHLPWQGTTDPYRIWLSEIMLQQTQVLTVIAYYTRFLDRFPSVSTLAQASLDDVMPYWAGLGYYARARNLHRCAQTIHGQYNGRFPDTAQDLATLPGIGRSTAAAIAAFAYGERSPIMDGNVKRVFTRYFGIYGDPARRATEQLLWETAQTAIQQAPADLDIRRYTQGLMDLGSAVCKRRNPDCDACPLKNDCYAWRRAAQHDLPERRIRKALPLRRSTMLILEHQDHVLLQRQSSPGIWGGLWSLPQFDDQQALDGAMASWNLAGLNSQTLEPITHTFSHFKLYIQPQYVVMNPGISVLREPASDQAWIAAGSLHDAALPAPVKTLLHTVFSTQLSPSDMPD